MNAALPANVSDLWFITGWTMIHFLWLGAIVAAAALVCPDAFAARYRKNPLHGRTGKFDLASRATAR